MVRKAKKMKNAKAVGPDEIPVEAWKSLERRRNRQTYRNDAKNLEGRNDASGVEKQRYNIYIQGEGRYPRLWKLQRDKVNVPHNEQTQQQQPFILTRLFIPVYWGQPRLWPFHNIFLHLDLSQASSYTMKIREKIIDQRLQQETTIGEEQFGFMLGRSTTDVIYILRQRMEKYREKQKGLHLDFIDLEKTYDRVPPQEVWRCMREKRTPEKYVRLVQDMYKEVKTLVRSSVGDTEKFTVKVGLHQGLALSPYLFDLIMDVIAENVKETPPWSMMFADDIALCATDREEVERKTENWRRVLEDRGMKVSRKKIEYMSFNEASVGNIRIQDHVLKKVKNFKYLGSTMSVDGELEGEIKKRIQAGWMNWRRLSGVLCDRRISVRKKGNVFKVAVRPAMTYGAETWNVKKAQKKKLDVAEMKMLRWICGHTRLDKKENREIRSRT